MATAGTRVTNVLLSSAHDRGVGGVQLVLRNLVNGLEQSGRHVYFVSDAPLPRFRMTKMVNSLGRWTFQIPMPTIVRNSLLLSVPVFLLCLPLTFLQLSRLIRRKRIDVINGHYVELYFLHLVIAARLLRVPIVVSVHGADIDRYAEASAAHRFVYRLIVRGAHRIVACSGALARQTMEIFPDARRKITYVHNGLELSKYVTTPPSRPLPRTFVLSVCRHVHKKGIDVLLRAFALVSRDVTSVSLVLVGGGPLLDEHRALARTLAIDSQVLFAGDVAHAEISGYLNACAVFVLPSRVEPFGLVLLEAAYHSKGIVSTRVGGVPEILTDDVDGLLVEADEPAAMAGGITRLLRQPELAARLGAAAHQTLLRRFLWSDRLHDYIDIYEGRDAGSCRLNANQPHWRGGPSDAWPPEPPEPEHLGERP